VAVSMVALLSAPVCTVSALYLLLLLRSARHGPCWQAWQPVWYIGPVVYVRSHGARCITGGWCGNVHVCSFVRVCMVRERE